MSHLLGFNTKAIESTNYINHEFAQQYDGSYLIRNAYHFTHPGQSSSAA